MYSSNNQWIACFQTCVIQKLSYKKSEKFKNTNSWMQKSRHFDELQKMDLKQYTCCKLKGWKWLARAQFKVVTSHQPPNTRKQIEKNQLKNKHITCEIQKMHLILQLEDISISKNCLPNSKFICFCLSISFEFIMLQNEIF